MGALETMASASEVPPDLPAWLYGGVAPHAGWTYSGAIAASLWRALATRPHPETVVLIGSHAPPRPPGRLATSTGYETPLGVLPSDLDLAREIAGLAGPYLAEGEDGRWLDNSVEMHLPMMRHFLPRARVVVLQIPADEAAAPFGQSLGAALAGRRAVVVASSDLTHYGPSYDWSPAGSGEQAERWARENDTALIDLTLALRPEGIVAEALTHRNACGPGGVAAAVAATRAMGATESCLLQYGTSLDVASYHSFVGYAAIVFGGEAPEQELRSATGTESEAL